MNAASKWTLGLWLALAASTPAAVEWDTVLGTFDGTDFSLTTGMNTSFEAGILGAILLDGGGLWAELTADNATIGLDHHWFLMDYDELVDAEALATSRPFVPFSDPEYATVRLNLNQSFYLGFQLGSTEHFPNAVQYGWAELFFDGAAVSVASSATERTGLGIYAGTGQAIPEPATAGLLLLGAAGLLRVRRRGRAGGVLRST